MPEISINIEFWCGRCGRGICHLASADRRKQGFVISPCPHCADDKYEEGYDAATFANETKSMRGKEDETYN